MYVCLCAFVGTNKQRLIIIIIIIIIIITTTTTQISGYSAYPDGSPSQLIRVSGVLQYRQSEIELKQNAVWVSGGVLTQWQSGCMYTCGLEERRFI
jgi:hypothetical protein